MELQEKEAQKRTANRKSVQKGPTVKKMSTNSRLKATKIIDQRKAFYRQRIPESSYVRK